MRGDEHVTNVIDRKPRFGFGIAQVFVVLIFEHVDNLLGQVLVGLFALSTFVPVAFQQPSQRQETGSACNTCACSLSHALVEIDIPSTSQTRCSIADLTPFWRLHAMG